MPWFYVDDAFADSKPVMRLDARLRNEAVGLWVRCGAWSAKEETDGLVPLDVVRQFNGTPRLIAALHQQAELWSESSPDSWRKSRNVVFGNWEKWQKTRAENEARRKREAEKKSTWRASQKGRNYVATSDDSEMSTGDTPGDMTGDSENVSTGDRAGESRYPDPTRPDPIPLSVVTREGNGTVSDARPTCVKHPQGNPSNDPCHGCGKVRKWEQQNAERLASDELEAKRRAREIAENCPDCNGSNLIDVGENEAAKCLHPYALQEAR